MKKSIFFTFIIILVNFKVVKSFAIICYYKSISHSVIGNLYACDTQNISTSTGNSVTNVLGEHDPTLHLTNDNVEALWINGNQNLNFFPKNFSSFFINIKAITIFDSTFKEFNDDELDEFPQLKFLSIVNSKLTTIPSSLFKNTPNIILVDFYNALIEQVGFYLFSSIDIAQLKWFVFQKNPCIDRGITNGNQTEIISIIKELQENCPLIGEKITTTTEKENLLTCSDKNIEELVCDLKDDIGDIYENLSTKDKRIEKVESNLNENLEKEMIKIREEMQAKDKEIQEMRLEFQSRISWLEEEILKMTTNPCACK